MSMIRQVTLRPFGRIRRPMGLRGTPRPWRGSSRKTSMWRLASQVSCAASLSLLARRRPDRHREAVLKDPRDVPFESPEMIDVGDDALARLAGDRRNHCHATGRHVDDLTGEFAAVGKHIAAEKIDA